MKPTPVSFNAHNINDGTNYVGKIPYETPLQASQPKVNFVQRSNAPPAYAGKEFGESYITLTIIAMGAQSGVNAKLETLNQWFNVYDETPYQLIVQDEDDSNKQWYIYATTRSVSPLVGTRGVKITLARKDPVWQSVNQNSTAWAITASGQTQAVTADGNIEAYPIFEFLPTSYPGGGWRSQKYCTIYPTSDYAFPNRPLDITGAWDTATIIGAGDMQADGDDLRVLVDGAEANYWIGGGGINSATTRIWVALDIPARAEVTLKTAIANEAASPTTIDVNYTTANYNAMVRMPNTGRLYIDTEEFAYTSKTVSGTTLNFGGTITRTLRGTTQAAHSAAATIRWIPYDISILYNNSAATAPVIDNTRKPIINMATSTNSSFVYAEFVGTGVNGAMRAGSWKSTMLTSIIGQGEATGSPGVFYFAVNDAATVPDPADVMGMTMQTIQLVGVFKKITATLRWELDMPDACTEITSNGHKYTLTTSWPALIGLQSDAQTSGWGGTGKIVRYVTEWLETVPPAATWTAWTHNAEAVPAGTRKLSFVLSGSLITTVEDYAKFEVTAATITITNAPSVTMRAAASSFKVSAVITNTTTGEFINLSFPLQTGKTLTIDTDPNNPYAKIDGQIVSGVTPNTIRAKWLKLQVGSNTLTYTSDSTGNVTNTVKWRDRMNFL